jgi:23S rRNA (guanosine2251-2'-O)-methyltransferase
LSSLLKVNAGNRKIYRIIINASRKNNQRISDLISTSGKKNIPFDLISPADFLKLSEEITGSSSNIYEDSIISQGVLALVSDYNYSDLETDLRNGLFNSRDSIIVILDEITDVGNFGAILRNCSAFGADGVIISKHRSAEAGSRVSRISSGALEEIKIYRVTNIVTAINKLKENGFWIYGTTLEAGKKIVSADSADYAFPLAIVLGSEQKGMGKLVSENCDILVKITMPGKMQSLNVSTSSGIFLYILNSYKNKKNIRGSK